MDAVPATDPTKSDTPGIITDTARQLAELTTLLAVAGRAQKAILAVSDVSTARHGPLVAEALSDIARLVSGAAEQSFYKPLPAVLTSDSYVLPRPLEKVHPLVLAELASSTPPSVREDAGLLLQGRPGSGKTEYPQFLASCTGEHVQYVTLNVNAIRATQNPPAMLTEIYAKLQADGAKRSSRFVLVLDEFDQLITANSEVHRDQRTTSSDTGTEKRFSSSRTETVTTDLKIDAIGQGLLNTIKIILGSEDYSRVYTIATTNMSELPDAVVRGGRFRRVTVDAFATLDPCGDKVAFLFDWYRDCLPRIVSIMDATHYRKHGVHNSVLGELKGFVTQIFDGHEDWLAMYDTRKAESPNERDVHIIHSQRHFDRDLRGFITEEQNTEVRDRVFMAMTGYTARNLSLTGDGSLRLHGGGREFISSSSESRSGREVRFITSATPSVIRQHYLAHEAEYLDLAQAKEALSALIFPQVAELKRNKK